MEFQGLTSGLFLSHASCLVENRGPRASVETWRRQGGCTSHQGVGVEVPGGVGFWVYFEVEPARFVDGPDAKLQAEGYIKVSAAIMVPSRLGFRILRRGGV